MELTTSNESEAWPRDFDFRAEVAEQQELLDQNQHAPEHSKESQNNEQN